MGNRPVGFFYVYLIPIDNVVFPFPFIEVSARTSCLYICTDN